MRQFQEVRRRPRGIAGIIVMACMLFYSFPAHGETAEGLLTPEEIRENIYCSEMITESDYLVAGDRGLLVWQAYRLQQSTKNGNNGQGIR